MWYAAGTVALTNNSIAVTGANLDFIANGIGAGDALVANGSFSEIARVTSSTTLELVRPWGGGSGSYAYAIAPIVPSRINDVLANTLAILGTFSGVRDGVGQGLFPDGTVAAPGIRFTADQDTGLRRAGTNSAALVAGGVDRLVAGPSGATVAGRISVTQDDTVGVPAPTLGSLSASGGFFGIVQAYGLLIGTNSNGNTWLQAQRIDGNPTAYDMLLQPSGGNLLVGATSGGEHTIAKAVAQGTNILRIQSSAAGAASSAVFAAVNVHPSNAAGAALYLGKSSQTDRSINAAGTINASGADYAEYMAKADGCGPLAKGDVCGVDADGRLTKSWAASLSFVVKSTDPAYVGGDSWASHLPPKPEDPGAAPLAPIEPGPEPDDAAALVDWAAARDAYPALLSKWMTDASAWEGANAAYDADLAAWNSELETSRRCVDRIAFAGQVPVNIAGPFAVGDYLIATNTADGGITTWAIAEADITFEQYRRRLGKVWAIREGRPWIDVQHG